jgi:hypothetical protein
MYAGQPDGCPAFHYQLVYLPNGLLQKLNLGFGQLKEAVWKTF